MNTRNDTSIRLRLTQTECEEMALVQNFLGLPSLSATAHRLALWNCRTLSSALSPEAGVPDRVAKTLGSVAEDAARLAIRRAIQAEGNK